MQNELDTQNFKHQSTLLQDSKPFAFFRAIGQSIFNTGKIFNSEAQIKKEHIHKISMQVSQLLEQNMLDVVYDIMESGYELNSQQHNIFHEQMRKKAMDKPFEFFESLLAKGYTIDDRYLIDSFWSNERYIDSRMAFKNKKEDYPVSYASYNDTYPLTLALLDEKIKNSDFTAQFFPTWREWVVAMKNDEFNYKNGYQNGERVFGSLVRVPLFALNEMNLMFNHVNMNDYLDVIQFMKDMKKNPYGNSNINPFYPPEREVESVIHFLQTNVSKLLPQQVEKLKAETQLVFKDTIARNTLKMNLNIARTLKFSDLPDSAQAIIESIEASYRQINPTKLPEEAQYELKVVFEKRIPETLQAYLSIRPEYRTELKNHAGENAQDLMLASLTHIKNAIDDMILTEQEESLKDLSVQKRLSQNLRKSI